jgi:hypothetical protein
MTDVPLFVIINGPDDSERPCLLEVRNVPGWPPLVANGPSFKAALAALAETVLLAVEGDEETVIHRSLVTDRPAHPVAAPCAIQHCQYFEMDRQDREAEGLIDRMRVLLTRTAEALKGTPPPGGWHSWHDLPEEAAGLRERITALEEEISRRLGDALHLREEGRLLGLRVKATEAEATRLRAEIERRVGPTTREGGPE